jgi:sugar lactone lactonase YvrE
VGVETEAIFARQLADALADLHDPVALRKHPFAGSKTVAGVQAELTAAIEGLKPGPQVDPSSKAWRPYNVLNWRYVEALDPVEVQNRLALSKSQYYREHEAAVATLAGLLADSGWATNTAPPVPVEAAAAPPTPARLWWRWPAVAVAASCALLLISALVVRPRLLRPGASPPGWTLSVYAGDGQVGHVNGAAAKARFSGLGGLAVDDGGFVYAADTGNHRVRSVTTSGLVLDLAGSGVPGYEDGPAASAQFSSPNAVTVTPNGTVYVGDAGNIRLRVINRSGFVSTLAGSGQAGYTDGAGTAAQFTGTGAIISGRDGMLYLPDAPTNVVRRITPDGVVSTYAGIPGKRGHVDGPPGVAQLNAPTRGGGVDAAGNVYVLDLQDSRIRKIAPDRSISTVAGTGVPGYSDGPASSAQFSNDILGVIADMDGNLFVMDAGNRRVRKVSKDGTVSTLYQFTNPDQTPFNIKVDPSGNLFISDRQHNVIYKLAPLR